MNKITINKYLIKVLTIAFVIGSSESARCPTQQEAINLDLPKFSGVWHIIATTPPPGASTTKCANISITSTDPNSFTMVYKKVTPRTGLITISATANRNCSGDFVGTYQSVGRPIGTYVQRIIEIDYDSHYAMIGCNTNPAVANNGLVLISSRQKTLSSEILEQLKSKARSYINSDTAIVNVDYSDCP